MDENRIFFKRDISWLSFNYRVLSESQNKKLPIFERIKFLSIFSSNLEEFYKIRISEYRQTIAQENNEPELKSRAKATLYEINKEVSRQMQDFFFIFRDEILPELARNNIILYQGEQPIIEMHRAFIRNYFYDEIFPFLQPVLILKDDISSFLRDNRLYLVIKLYKKSNAELCSNKNSVFQSPQIHFSSVYRRNSLFDVHRRCNRIQSRHRISGIYRRFLL